MSGANASPADPAGRLAPSPDVLAAIELAVEQCWPGAGRSASRMGAARPGWSGGARHPWRFSARWWSPELLDGAPERPGWGRGG